MCIISYVPKDKKIDDATITNMFDANPDGAGILYTENEVLKTYKTFDVFKLINMYHYIKDTLDTDMILHFRIGTHGGKTFDNIHPFLVNEDLGFVHNGIITSVPIDTAKSDTRMFNELILQELPDNFVFNEAVKELISGYIGSSKLAFMDTWQNVVIINEHKGTWDEGVWYSNDSYLDFNDYYYPAYTKYNKKHKANATVATAGTSTRYYGNDYYDNYGDGGEDTMVNCHNCGEMVDAWEANLDLNDHYYCEACYDICLEICPNCEGDLGEDNYCENCGLSFDNVYETLALPASASSIDVVGEDDNDDVETYTPPHLKKLLNEEEKYESWLETHTDGDVIDAEEDKEIYMQSHKDNIIRLGTTKDSWIGATYGNKAARDTEFKELVTKIEEGRAASVTVGTK